MNTISSEELLTLIKEIKCKLMHNRRFGSDTIHTWRSSAIDAERDLEDIITRLSSKEVQ